MWQSSSLMTSTRIGPSTMLVRMSGTGKVKLLLFHHLCQGGIIFHDCLLTGLLKTIRRSMGAHPV